VHGLAAGFSGRITDSVHQRKRRRHGHVKHLLASSSPSSSSAAAAAESDGIGKRKNAVMLLNELQPGGLHYHGVSKSGPDHKPTYTASITVYGQVPDLSLPARVTQSYAVSKRMTELVF